MPAIYALLIGINKYPLRPLEGCVNDAKAMEKYLQDSYGKSASTSLQIKKITDEDEQPTRENIINGFSFFEKAKEGDTCLIYYSGHGSFSPAPPEFWTETDGYNESFVCADSRLPGGRDLMDKEMGFLIWKTTIEQPGTHVIVITDCCHAGTITKALTNNRIKDKMYPPDQHVPVSLTDYYGYALTIKNQKGYTDSIDTSGKARVTVKQGNHIHLASSQDNQTSKELMIEGIPCSAFTYSLLQTLYSSKGNISYRELVEKTSIRVKNTVDSQYPLLNINGNLNDIEGEKIFLSQEIAETRSPYTVYYSKQFGWCLNAGAIHGVCEGDEVSFGIQYKTKVIGAPHPDFSVLMDNPHLTDKTNPYEVTVNLKGSQRLTLAFADEVSKNVREIVTTAIAKKQFPLLEITEADKARYVIRQQNNNVFISLPGSNAPAFELLMVSNIPEADLFLKKIDTVRHWLRTEQLYNPISTFTKKDYSLSVYSGAQPGNYDASSFKEISNAENKFDLFYLFDNAKNKWQQPAFRLKFTNNTDQFLWVSCLCLGFDYGIDNIGFKMDRVAPKAYAWHSFNDNGNASDVIKWSLDKKYSDLGYTDITEYLKLFISTEAIDTSKFLQEGLKLAAFTAKSINSKGPGSDEENLLDVKSNDWQAETIALHIIKPQKEVTIAANTTTKLNNIVIEAHPSLTGKISLNSSSLTSKSADGIAAPHLANRNSELEPLSLVNATKGSSSPDIMELYDVQNKNAVNSENPMIIQLPQITDGEPALPIGYDINTGLYYPLGFMDADGKMIIETLPDETATDSAITQKSFTGSIKIYFQKVIGQKLGLAYNYPRLAKVTINNDGSIGYDADPTSLKEAVKKASNIILFVHGIIGDTEGMVKCVKTSLDDKGATLEKKSQLVLAFDYENLNTEIQENSKLLKQKLEAIGITEGSGKQLTIIAHSMGGLVSRWMIEKLNGNKIVHQLIMLGTPNNGTPWADVRDMAETLLTYAMNGVSLLKPWMFLLSLVGKLAKGTQVAFKQMDSKTGIYSLLNDGTDPVINYTIIAGNTQLIHPKVEETGNLISRLFQRVKKRGIYTALDLALFKKPNDIAVTDESIVQIKDSEKWKQTPKIFTVESDHMNYFVNLKALQSIPV